jgi:hypothetical protein
LAITLNLLDFPTLAFAVENPEQILLPMFLAHLIGLLFLFDFVVGAAILFNPSPNVALRLVNLLAGATTSFVKPTRYPFDTLEDEMLPTLLPKATCEGMNAISIERQRNGLAIDEEQLCHLDADGVMAR